MSMLTRALPELGQVLAGKYRLVRKLGEGGMGVVFEAEHMRIKQRVAIKMLLPEVLELPDVVSRFEREARAAGQLRSENTARVLDVDVSEEGMPYMVMEFLDGYDLSQILEQRAQLPIELAVDYVLQACNAMAEAHAAGIVHRDLKPSNLFLVGGERGTVKVLDFGISKVENDKDNRVTATQTVVGTPLYMSPEQVRSAKHVDARTDIWALGIILYELIAGKTPFEGNMTAAAAAICIDEPPPLTQFRQDVPPDLADHIRVCLEKDPSKRYPNVQSLAVAIAPFGTGAVRSPDSSQPNIVLPRPSTRSLSDGGAHAHTVVSSPELHRDGRNRTIPGWTTGGTAHGSRNRLVVIAAAAAVAAMATVFVIYLTVLRHGPATEGVTTAARGDTSHAASVAAAPVPANSTSTVGIAITDLPQSSASVAPSAASRSTTTSTHTGVKPPPSAAPVPTPPPSASHKVNPLHL